MQTLRCQLINVFLLEEYYENESILYIVIIDEIHGLSWNHFLMKQLRNHLTIALTYLFRTVMYEYIPRDVPISTATGHTITKGKQRDFLSLYIYFSFLPFPLKVFFCDQLPFNHRKKYFH